MSDIQIYHNSGDNAIQPIKTALNSKMVSQLYGWELLETIKPLVALCFFNKGFTTEGVDMNLLINQLIKRIKRESYNLRIDEIEIAFNNGIYGKYGKFFGINPATLMDFIKAYIADPDRKEALRIKNLPPPSKVMPTKQQMFRAAKKNALRGFLSCSKSKTGSTELLGSVIYDFFFNIKLFVITQEEINDCYKRATNIHLAELRSKKEIASDPLKRREIDGKITAYIDQISNGKDAGAAVWSVAKRIYIDDLFHAMIEFEECTIKDVINMINGHYPQFIDWITKKK